MNSCRPNPRAAILAVLPLLALATLPSRSVLGQPRSGERQRQEQPRPATDGNRQRGETRVPVQFIGGYDTDQRDRGRPVVLISAGLNVPVDVFRAAFRSVRPAGAGNRPEPSQVRQNKAALLGALGAHGVTNERLDTVSDYYRNQPGRGELWRHRPATAYATIRGGAVVGFTVTDPGFGYSSIPAVKVRGFDRLTVRPTIAYGIDLERNGSISGLALANR